MLHSGPVTLNETIFPSDRRRQIESRLAKVPEERKAIGNRSLALVIFSR